MSEEKITKIFEMISAAGAARSKFMEAIAYAEEGKFDEAHNAIAEGEGFYGEAHHVHAAILAEESCGMEEGAMSSVNLILVHAEDQMMCAESFRLIAEKLVNVYKKIEEKA